MTVETQMALLVLTELLTTIRAKDAQGFRQWLDSAFDTLGLSAVEEMFRKTMAVAYQYKMNGLLSQNSIVVWTDEIQ